MRKGITVKDLCFMALYAAIFIVLDYIAHLLPLLQMPQGGSVGLGTIALLLASYHLGWKNGIVVGMLSVPLQYITGQMYVNGIFGLVFDYIVPFGIYGIASMFVNKGDLYPGIIFTNLIRFACHVMTGVVIWETALWGSITYNGPYMLATCIVDILVVPILYKRLKSQM